VQEDFRLIIDFVSVLAAATAGGLLAAFCRQPALLGYILGGMIVGPAGLGLIKEIVPIETMAQLGVAFLLFALGVEFSLTELKKVQAIALGGGSLQIILTILVTTCLSLFVGWVSTPVQGVFLGAILSLSSTAVVMKCLMERNEAETPQAQVMLGVLVVQDLALGLMLAVLPALDQPPEAIGIAIALAVLKIALFGLGAVAAGKLIMPKLLRLLAKTESRELFLLGVVGLCLGIAILTEKMGLSIEMGAFVAGLMISEVEYADQTLNYVEPLRDVFGALFFAAIGMLIDPVFLWQNLELILSLVLLVLVGKFLIFTPLVKAFGYPWKTAVIAGVGLAQIGEFSFVLASEGQTMGIVSREVYLLLVGTTAVTLVVTPFLLGSIPRLFDWVQGLRGEPSFPHLDQSLSELATAPENFPLKDHVVICGYGKTGQNLGKMLQSHDYPVVVIDHSEAAMQKLREADINHVYGNAASFHVLEKAGIDRAKSMVVLLPDAMSMRLTLKRALELNPELDVVVRSHHDRDIEMLYQLGANSVVQPEFEASLEVASHLLGSIGFPKPAIWQEMEQIRSSHYLDLRPVKLPSEIIRDFQQVREQIPSLWYALPPESPLVGMSWEETKLRQLTGVSLLAVKRLSGAEIDYPEGDIYLEEGDRLLIVGENEEITAFQELAQGDAVIPLVGNACQWLLLPADSPVVGSTLQELHLRRQYGVQVQVIRREGKFISFPDGAVELLGGDRLLLCGDPQALKQVEEWFLSPLLNPITNPVNLPIPVLQVNTLYQELMNQKLITQDLITPDLVAPELVTIEPEVF
jgi:CPA2 family monovalent cation:H+ antiporter-2